MMSWYWYIVEEEIMLFLEFSLTYWFLHSLYLAAFPELLWENFRRIFMGFEEVVYSGIVKNQIFGCYIKPNLGPSTESIESDEL